MRSIVIAILIISVSPCIAGEPAASSWTEFRNGGSSHSASEVPVSWSPDKGISWQKELPGYGQSSPVVFNGRVYLTTVVGSMKDECQILSFDLKTGEQIWVWSQEASTTAASDSARPPEPHRRRWLMRTEFTRSLKAGTLSPLTTTAASSGSEV